MNRLSNAQTFLATYKQYKEDTKYIAGWLAESSHSIGHQLNEAQNGHSRPKAKSKGEKGKNNNRNAGKGGQKKYSIKVSDFVPMAQAIADNATDVPVPVALSKLFNRAIQTRKKVANWFKHKAINAEKDSNERHHYFITVLENAFQLLRPFISSGSEAYRPEKQGAAPDELSFQNRFANLTVEDIAEIAEHEGAEESKLPNVVKVILEQDESELEEELKFAVGLFLEELQNMSEAACAQWSKYKNDQVDLIVAAMTTDTAIKLAQRAETEFDLVVKRPKSYPTDMFPVWKLLDAIMTPPGGEAPPESKGEQQANTFWPTYTGLKYYFDRIVKWDSKKNLPAIVRWDFGDRKLHDYTLRAIEFAQIVRIGMFGSHPDVWDMCSQGVENAFNERKLFIWVTFAVQIHLASQDIMADGCSHPSFELESHLQKMIRQNNKMMRDWARPFLPEYIYEDCFIQFGEGILNIQEWSSNQGFDKQWQDLLQNKQVASHPVLKTLRKEKNYYMRHHPLLCGMMKYEMYLKMQAAGMKLEHQSLSICMMAHIYINGRLQFGDIVPVWPDMELIIYAQDPDWLFVGGRPRSVKEAHKKFLLVLGSKVANFARDTPFHRRKIDQRKLREFRDTMMFGSGVYLPRDKFSQARVNVCTVKVEDLVTRLVETINSPQPWGRLARQLIISNAEKAQSDNQEDTSASSQATPRKVLNSYAQWLQMDLVNLYFDWLQMGYTCGTIWAQIRDDLERLPNWDPVSFPGRAIEPTIDILTRDSQYPTFLRIAYSKVREPFRGYPAAQFDSDIAPDICLFALGKYHRATAATLEAPGPLNLSNLYAHWDRKDWEPRWDKIKSKPRNEVKDIFVKSILGTFKCETTADPDDVDYLLDGNGNVLEPDIDHLLKACKNLGYLPKQLREGPVAGLKNMKK